MLLLGQSQNEIELLEFFWKNPLRSLNMVIELIGMIRCIKDSFSSRNSISNNDNMCSVLNLNCSINSAPNGKEFCFSRHYIHCMMNSFCNNVLTSVNVRDQGGNIVSDTSVQNNEDYVLVNEGIFINVIKFDMI